MRSEQVGPDLLEQMGYESRDVNIKQSLIAVVALIGFFVLSMVGIALFYSIFIPNWAKLDKPEPIPVNRRLPPHPQLQTDPRRDFEMYRQAEDKQVSGQGAAMSIDQAIDTLATQRGVAGVRGDAIRERGTSYPGARTAGAEGQSEGSEKSQEHGAGEAHGEASEAGHGAH